MESSYFSEGLELDLNVLSTGLPSENFYKTLNHDRNGLNKYENECKSLCSKTKVFDNKIVCSLLLRYLESASKRSQIDDSTYDNCILFNYWLYGELERRYRYKYNSKVIPAFGELNREWSNLIEDVSKTSYYNKCKPDFEIPYQDDWKKRKELYDYCVNYETLSRTANNYNNSCKKIYRYIKEFYSKCEGYHPDTVLRLLNCHNDMKEEESLLSVKAPSKESLQDIPPGGKLPSDGLQLKNDSSPPSTQAGNVFLGVVVTSMTSGALYKFTPLGNMLRNRFGWNSNMRNFNGGDNGLFDYASGSFNPYSGGAEEHYIGYHQA
ncbi:PIR protein [Plasmodium vivax]|uniref:VIR protein n=1 Tax=Plasmodium vivax TaxID=5855 RepID=A0A565A7B4_PLAVI|nr:PIR protein [Plasmodium vivax]